MPDNEKMGVLKWKSINWPKEVNKAYLIETLVNLVKKSLLMVNISKISGIIYICLIIFLLDGDFCHLFNIFSLRVQQFPGGGGGGGDLTKVFFPGGRFD